MKSTSAKNVELRFGRILKRERKRVGFSQLQLAQKSRVTYKHIQKLEGKNPAAVRFYTLLLLCKAFKTTPANFLKGL